MAAEDENLQEEITREEQFGKVGILYLTPPVEGNPKDSIGDKVAQEISDILATSSFEVDARDNPTSAKTRLYKKGNYGVIIIEASFDLEPEAKDILQKLDQFRGKDGKRFSRKVIEDRNKHFNENGDHYLFSPNIIYMHREPGNKIVFDTPIADIPYNSSLDMIKAVYQACIPFPEGRDIVPDMFLQNVYLRWRLDGTPAWYGSLSPVQIKAIKGIYYVFEQGVHHELERRQEQLRNLHRGDTANPLDIYAFLDKNMTGIIHKGNYVSKAHCDLFEGREAEKKKPKKP